MTTPETTTADDAAVLARAAIAAYLAQEAEDAPP
jgi:hypothetical protein